MPVSIINIDKITSKVLNCLLNKQIINFKYIPIMKNAFSCPQECFSRQEAVETFRKRGFHGTVEIGVAVSNQKEFIAWRCISPETVGILPILKKTPDVSATPVEDFVPLENECTFQTNGKFYYIDTDGQLQRIDTLSNEPLACNILSLMSEENISEVELCQMFHDNELENIIDICWVGKIEGSNIPRVISVFPDENKLFIQRCLQDTFPMFKTMDTGSFFEHDHLLWQVREDEFGKEIIPFCSASGEIS